MFKRNLLAHVFMPLMSAEGDEGGGGGSPPAPPPASPPAAPPPPPASPPAAPPPPATGKFYEKVEGLTDEDKVWIEKNGYKDLPSVFKSARHNETLIGADKATLLKLPADRSDPKAMGEVFEALGRPKDVGGYAIKENPEIGIAGEPLKAFLAGAHEQGLTKSQMDWLMQNRTAQAAQEMEQLGNEIKQGAAETEAALRKELGGAYETKVKAANDFIGKHFGKEFAEFLEKSGLGNNAEMIRGFVKLADLTGEGGLPGDRGRDIDGQAMTPAEAEAKLRDFEQKNQKALGDKNDPHHKALVAERTRLIKFTMK